MTQHIQDTSLNIQNENLAKLKAVFPNFVHEDKIDFDALKEFFASENMLSDDGTYGLAWNGKKQAYKNIAIPATGTLMFDDAESKDAGTTKNIFIEGDNLEVLKLLQKKYMKSIKMIYIDPPYNTGKDFVYSDNFRENISDYYEKTGQTQGGVKMTTNTDTNGRYHSDWLTMMYPRLFLARNLLQDDGVIFVSIDDNEVHNLRMILDEIFGEENLVDVLIWKKRYQGAKEKFHAAVHEYIFVYAKNKILINDFSIKMTDDFISKYFKLKDDKYDIRGGYRTQPLEAGASMDERKNLVFPVFGPNGVEILPKKQWVWSKERVDEANQNNELDFTQDSNGNWSVRFKQYLKDNDGLIRRTKPFSIIDNTFTQDGTKEINNILGNNIFNFPKPSKLIRQFLDIITWEEKNSLILDFFAGSGTTAHAVMELNAQDGGERRCISVQLPELTDEKSEAYKAGYTKISQITRERIRRAGEKIKVDYAEKLAEREIPLDIGFKAFVLKNSNYRKWKNLDETNSSEDILTQSKLLLEKPLVDDATELGVVYEVLVKEGFNLLAIVEYDAKLGVYRVRDEARSMTICFAKSLSLEFVTSLGLAENEIFVCYDSALDDALKVNLVKHYEVRVV